MTNTPPATAYEPLGLLPLVAGAVLLCLLGVALRPSPTVPDLPASREVRAVLQAGSADASYADTQACLAAWQSGQVATQSECTRPTWRSRGQR